MEITYLKLKNVAGIYRGMSLDNIEIDFTLGLENIITILNGGNGSGKSTIINSLDPHATESIRKNKKGFKEIHFKHKKDIYIIKHFYEPTSTGHSVKSFLTHIDKHGVMTELNENGNATPFKELVSIHLGIDQDSIKLLKLGAEMSNMTHMTPSERKKFISNFTKDTDLFLTMYKKINSDHILISKLVKNYADKLNNLGDIDVVKQKLKLIEEDIDNVSNKEINVKTNYNKLQDEYNNIFSMEDANRLSILEKEYKEISKTKEKLQKEFGDIIKKDIMQIDSELQRITSKKDESFNLKSVYSSTITTFQNQLKNISTELYDINVELDKLDIDDSYDIDNEIKSVEKFINKNQEIYNKYKDIFKYNSSKSLVSLGVYFDEKRANVYNCLEQLEACDVEGFSLETNYNSMYIDANNKLSLLKSSLAILENDLENYKKIFKDGFTCDNTNCPLLQNILSGKHKDIASIEYKIGNIEFDIIKASSNIERIYTLVQLQNVVKEIITKLQEVDSNITSILGLDKNKIIKDITNSKCEIYDSIKLQNLIAYGDTIIEFNDKQEYLIKLKNISIDIKARDNLLNRKNELDAKYKENSTLISDYSNKIILYTGEYDKYSNLEENLIYLKANKKQFDEFENMYNEIELLRINKQKSYYIYEQMNDLAKQDKQLNYLKESLAKDRDKLVYKKREIKKITKEKKIYEENFKDIAILRKALSTNEGIPLIFVQLYLQKTRKIANELIKDAFDGRIELGEFIINDKMFKIPLVGEGISEEDQNEDISKASAGERSIITLALSLALVQQNASKYNVLILDELDGPLDSKRRRTFLRLLEKRIEKLKIHQVFVISHNDLFNDYPTNLILLRDANMENNDNKNVIFEY